MTETGDAAEQVLQFKNIFNVVRGDRSEGALKMNAKGLAFKSALTGNLLTGELRLFHLLLPNNNNAMTVQRADIAKARWMQVASGFQLRLTQVSMVTISSLQFHIA
jgi:hypothetical protein